jgi:hypothetical protein
MRLSINNRFDKKGIKRTAKIAFKASKASNNHGPLLAKLASTWAYETCCRTRVKADIENITFEDKKGTCSAFFRTLKRSPISSLWLEGYRSYYPASESSTKAHVTPMD